MDLIASAKKLGYILSGVDNNLPSVSHQQNLSTMVLRKGGRSRFDEVETKNFLDLKTIGIREEEETQKIFALSSISRTFIFAKCKI